MFEKRGFLSMAYQESVMEAAFEALGYETKNSRIRTLEAKLATLCAPQSAPADLEEQATLKLNRGQPVSPTEAAVFLHVDKKLFQRMRRKGGITPCIARGSLVRYAARDVLRLASAPRKER